MKKVIISLVSGIIGVACGIIGSQYLLAGKKQNGGKVGKFKNYYNMLNQWLALRQNNQTLEKYFHENNYKNIAIYGVGEMGCRLSDELNGTGITIEYGIDKEPGNTYAEYEVYSLEDEFPNVDAVVVTAIFAFEEIEKVLKKKFTCPVISLEDIIYSL